MPGDSGAKWRIEAKGVLKNGEGFVIVECRRYTTSRLNQEELGGIANRIRDTRAKGGITVSPLDLQSGAKLVAAHAGITHVRLSEWSTQTSYFLSFLNQVLVGIDVTEGNDSAAGSGIVAAREFE